MSEQITNKNVYNKNGQMHGYWEFYYSNGNLCYRGNFDNGQRHGYWEAYHSNGNLSYKGNYVNGQKHGYWEEYFSNKKHKTYYL